MQHLGGGVHHGHRRLRSPRVLYRKSQKELRQQSRRRGDHRRHRSAHRRTDPLGAGQHPRGRASAHAEHHPPDGLRRGYLRPGQRPGSPLRLAPHPAPPLPRHRERQTRRRLRRNRQILRHRPRLGAAGALPADAPLLFRRHPLPVLVRAPVRQPVRHLPDLLLHHVVRRPTPRPDPSSPKPSRSSGRLSSSCSRSSPESSSSGSSWGPAP